MKPLLRVSPGYRFAQPGLRTGLRVEKYVARDEPDGESRGAVRTARVNPGYRFAQPGLPILVLVPA